MSNMPPELPPSPRKGRTFRKRIQYNPITCRVDLILEVNKVNDRVKVEGSDIVVVLGHDSSKKGKGHELTLYGKKSLLLKPNTVSIVGKVAHFHVQILSDTKSKDGTESEKVGNIQEYFGNVDKKGRFSL